MAYGWSVGELWLGVWVMCGEVGWGSGVGCGWDVVGWDDVWVVRNVGGVQLELGL